MLVKLAKILALGMGAVAVTGIPSGVITDQAGPSYEVQIGEYFSLQDECEVWQMDNKPDVRSEELKPRPTVNLDVETEIEELDEAPAPTPLPLGQLTKSVLKKNAVEETDKKRSLVMPRLRVLLPTWQAPPRRPRQTTSECLDVPDPEPGWSGTAFQYEYASYSGTPGVCYPACYIDSREAYAMSLSGSTHPDELGSPTGQSKTSSDPTTFVPEPAGLLAILAGLPGLGMILRRRTI